MTNQEARTKYVELKGKVTDEEWAKITEGVETDEAWETLTASFAEDKSGDGEKDKGGDDGKDKDREEKPLEEQLAGAVGRTGAKSQR